ncbi:MAG: hypothetical protein WCS77_10555 [Elusimicrobiaceae bacterium]
MRNTLSLIAKILAAAVWLAASAATVYFIFWVAGKGADKESLWGWYVTGTFFWAGISLVCFNILTMRKEENPLVPGTAEPEFEQETEPGSPQQPGQTPPPPPAPPQGL